MAFPNDVDRWYQIGTIECMAMTLRTDEELDAALTALAEASGLSRQEVIRRAVLNEYERAGHRARVDAIAAEVVVEYAEALERLGAV